VNDSNSAAHVSTRLNTARCALYYAVPHGSGVVFQSCAVVRRWCRCAWLRDKSSGTVSTVTDAIRRWTAEISCICWMNHGSIFVSSVTSRATIRAPGLQTAMNAVRTGVAIFSRSMKPACPQERARGNWFERANTLLQRFLERPPTAITSPTDFICVPSVESAPANFSNCHFEFHHDCQSSARRMPASSA